MVFNIGDSLNALNDMGFFYYVVPFLIIFAIVFAILDKSEWLGKNKAVKSIVSASIGLLTIQFGLVQEFFDNIFPKMGVGLAIILVALIFIGFFVDTKKAEKLWWMGGIMAAVVIIWTLMSVGSLGGYGYYSFWDLLERYGLAIFIILAVVGGIIAITKDDKPAKTGG